jgi:FlaA1/EpsC-like NDP-sugar epimerase
MESMGTRFVCRRNGDVLGSRGSAIPLVHEQVRGGGLHPI